MRVALIYPGIESSKSGVYLDTKTGQETNKECSVISLSVDKDIKKWQKDINERVETWMSARIES
jgi:5-methylcytosine-specific restriction enzyme subunit McrC